jgi:lipoprotein-releasing system ATP-binding protein
MSDDPQLLEALRIRMVYPATGHGPDLEVLSEVSIALRAGESLAVTGPSGSGKSTLLHIVGGLERPTSGQVLVNGRDIASLSEKQGAALRSAEIGFVFQDHHLLPQCTVMENVLIPSLALPGGGPPPADRAETLARRVGLAERLSHFPSELSGGERQRVALIRALINEPSLLLADEPTGALDRQNADALADLLVELNREKGTGLIVVTHAEALAQRMGRGCRLIDGRLEAS